MNFGGIPEEYDQLDSSPIVVLPIPYDKTSTWIKGADKGPEAILEASANMELYDIETDSEVYKLGIHTMKPITEDESPEKMVEAVYSTVKDLLEKDKFIVSLGGEHSISAGIIKAYSESYDEFSVLQLDAHSDTREEYDGSPYNHACVMARAKEVCPVIQVGIRSMDVSEIPNVIPSRMFKANDIRKNEVWISQIVRELTDNVYITIDLDVFDPSIMPSTGTPEPGGLLWYQVIDLLEQVNAHTNIVGFDVVELCPNPENRASDFLASKLIYQLLSMKFAK